MATKKKKKKMIRMLAATMPTVVSTVHEVHRVKGSELIEQGHTELEPGVKVNPEKYYTQNMPVVIQRNHARRIQRQLSSAGRNGVTNYVEEIKKIYALNEEQI